MIVAVHLVRVRAPDRSVDRELRSSRCGACRNRTAARLSLSWRERSVHSRGTLKSEASVSVTESRLPHVQSAGMILRVPLSWWRWERSIGTSVPMFSDQIERGRKTWGVGSSYSTP